MFVRYKADKKGKAVPVCKIYTPSEHPISSDMVDKDALWVVRRIQEEGGEAYIVGGAVRDLLLSRTPHDFDIATSLSPKEVKQIFRNSRIIGKRFRIVHIFFGAKIIEVTTFRSDKENFEDGHNNLYGTIEQDAKRRDFSINSLYYDPNKGELLDFANSLDDIKNGVIRSLIPLKYAFTEDPVRMIRAIKYKETTSFILKPDVVRAIKHNSANILGVSPSRLTEEVFKILSSGFSYPIILSLYEYRLLQYLLPSFSLYVRSEGVEKSLKELDERVKSDNQKKIQRSELIYYLVKSLIIINLEENLTKEEYLRDGIRQVKVLLSPITPSNLEIEKAVTRILVDNGFKMEKKKRMVLPPTRTKNINKPKRRRRLKRS